MTYLKKEAQLPEFTKRLSPGTSVGTSLQGYVHCSYSDLCLYLGKPDFPYACDEAHWSWRHLGNQFTVYSDSTDRTGNAIFENTCWHIGGHNDNALVAFFAKCNKQLIPLTLEEQRREIIRRLEAKRAGRQAISSVEAAKAGVAVLDEYRKRHSNN